uniref:Uncharacterized protein n=1 Tax=Arundo donax TaxID=35708 RepID=A0A0A9AR94_ARUDO
MQFIMKLFTSALTMPGLKAPHNRLGQMIV